jgi:hypothetical protein
VTTLGTVKSWNDDEGWGVLTSPELDEDVWAHFVYVDALERGDERPTLPKARDSKEQRGIHERNLAQV